MPLNSKFRSCKPEVLLTMTTLLFASSMTMRNVVVMVMMKEERDKEGQGWDEG